MKRIPKFKSLEEERKFWATHSITGYLDELKPVKVKFLKPKKKLISLRLETPQIQSLKEIASRKGLGYLSLIRYWINERLSKEHQPPHLAHRG
ncbi:MAG: CopG family antitoxin [Candidatus Omnitrophota bacterium]